MGNGRQTFRAENRQAVCGVLRRGRGRKSFRRGEAGNRIPTALRREVHIIGCDQRVALRNVIDPEAVSAFITDVINVQKTVALVDVPRISDVANPKI